MEIFDVTLVADTNIYADNDVLAVPQAIAGVFSPVNVPRKLDTVLVLDEDDQGTAIDLIFFNASATLGTINDVAAISDADARKIVGHVSIAAADFHDLVNSQYAMKTGLGLIMKGADESSDLYIGAMVRSGTPTYSAGGLKLKLGFSDNPRERNY